MKHSLLFPFVASMFALATTSTAVAAVKAPGLSFFRFEIPSENPDSWQTLSKADAASGSEILGLFSDKKNPKIKLMAFRKSDLGYKVCDAEKRTMKKSKTPFRELKPIKGWACLYKTKDRSTERLIGIRTFLVRSKTMSSPFSLAVAADSVSQDRFIKMATSLKETM